MLWCLFNTVWTASMSETGQPKSGNPPAESEPSGDEGSHGVTGIPAFGNSVLGALGSTVDGLQNSLSNAYQNMAGTLAQSVNMMQTMNTLMEDFLKQSVRIESEVSFRADGVCLLKLSVTNACRFPLPSASLKLEFVKRNSVDPALFMCTMEDTGADLDEYFKCVDLPCESTTIHKVLLQAPFTAQFNCTAAISFPSPGTGQLLVVSHTFGVYIFHQCQISELDAENTAATRAEGGEVEDVVEGNSFRRLFRIPPVRGVPIGTKYRISAPDGYVDVMAEVLGATTDGDGIKLAWSAMPQTVDTSLASSTSQKRLDSTAAVATLMEEVRRLERT